MLAVNFRLWWQRLRDPHLPGMGDHAPVAKLWVAVLAAMGLAGLAIVRYYGVLKPDVWVWLYTLVGLAWMALVVCLGHGIGWLRALSLQTRVVYAVGLLALGGFWYLGRLDAFAALWAPHVPPDWPLQAVLPFAYFSGCGLLFRLAIPALSARALGLHPRDLGWAAGERGQTATVWPIYLLLYLVVLPAVWIAAGSEAFQSKYPMARALIGPDKAIDLWEFLAYQLAYALVFVSGEAFWRGWLTFGTVRDLGSYSIVFMLVPYVVAHFGKPLPETLGAIAAGSVLGWLALQHRSVWLGAALHYGVAVTMDLSAIYKGGLWFAQSEQLLLKVEHWLR